MSFVSDAVSLHHQYSFFKAEEDDSSSSEAEDACEQSKEESKRKGTFPSDASLCFKMTKINLQRICDCSITSSPK